MPSRLFSAAVWGVDAIEVVVEVARGEGEFRMVVVGLPDAAVKESRDRVKAAIESSGYRFPWGVITVNLAPADLKKAGPSFDLPMALGLLMVHDGIKAEQTQDFWVVGELALNGEVRPVRGVLPIALAARQKGCRRLLVPAANAEEALVAEGLEIIPIRHLREAADYLEGKSSIEAMRAKEGVLRKAPAETEFDFSEVKGQQSAKRAMEVAVAGGHNLMLCGEKGCGKSMLAKRIPGICPAMTLEETLETTKIHSVAGLIKKGDGLLESRPFRSPHHTISDAGLIGGTSTPSPGEVSLAHNGVLFLDELPEFNRRTLEVMRQPLEDGKVSIARAVGTVTFPARFMLVAAMNPTPTGSKHDVEKGKVSAAAAQRYRNRVSGPLLDRIDIQLELQPVKHEELLSAPTGERSEAIRGRVTEARRRQQRRFSGRRNIHCNAQMTSRDLQEHCRLKESGLQMLRYAMGEMNLSARAYDRILKVSRTIADLAGEESILDDHLAEAIQYRSLDRQLWG